MEEWIVVPNWEKFQHYKDRAPVWIKMYTELSLRHEWLGLSLSERGLLVSIWMAYARTNGVLSTRHLHSIITATTRTKQLERLNHAGFITFSASRPLAQSKRESKNPPSPPLNGKPKTPPQRVTGCRLVRGSHGVSFVSDPAGTDRPPRDWPGR